MQKKTTIFRISDEKSLDKIVFPVKKWDIIFLYGDLWAWKSTFVRTLLRKYFDDNSLIVRSPTYTYYNSYQKNNINFVHFDLYRLDDLENFYLIGGNEIIEDHTSICLIEWPEIIENIITPTKIIKITIDTKTGERIFEITENL